jgi:hypothetical protein
MRILIGIAIGAIIAVTWPEQTQNAHEWSREQIHTISSRIAQHTDDSTVIVLPWRETE